MGKEKFLNSARSREDVDPLQLYASAKGLGLDNLFEQYEVRLRPRDGTPASGVPESEFGQHLLLTHRTTKKQYRVRSSVQDPITKEQVLDLYEVFEGEKFAPSMAEVAQGKKIKKFTFDKDLLNDVWEWVMTAEAFKPYRLAMRKATSFSLDTEATELVTRLASDRTKVPLYRKLARLPYDQVWLDFDYQARVGAQRGLGDRKSAYDPSNEPLRMGYLIERTGETRWKVTSFTQLAVNSDIQHRYLEIMRSKVPLEEGDSVIEVMPPQFILDTENPMTGYKTHIKDQMMAATVQTVMDGGEGLMSGLAWGVTAKDGGEITYKAPAGLEDCVRMDLPPDWENFFKRSSLPPAEKIKGLRMIFADVAAEQAGVLRFICAALATINEVPMSLKEVHTKGSFRASGEMRPFKVNRIVELRLLKRQQTPKHVLRLFRGAERRMARHQVRGHWRRYWIKDDSGQRVMIRKWLEPFERGDAALGYVLHKYEVKT